MENKTMALEIAMLTAELVANHGRRGMVKEFTHFTGLGPRIFDCYRKGTRVPDRFMLYYLAGTDSLLHQWAAKCLQIRAKYGSGLPRAQ